MCQNAFFPCLQENRMCRFTKKNKKQMYDQLKRRYNCHRKKFPALFKTMLKKQI